MESAAAFRILLVHDGDLGFVANLLNEFGAPFEERVGAPTREDRQARWNVVVANATRMREIPAGASGRRIAILNEDSRTLRSMLRRLGVDLMVRRPVHPTAFRLLLLHALYNGPERRQSARTSIGTAIKLRVGLRKHDAILLDLSHTGCRVMPEVQVTPGKRVKAYLPPEIAGDRKLILKGRAVRTETVKSSTGTRKAVGVLFDALNDADRKRLFKIIEEHQRGPAMMAAVQKDGVPVAPEQTLAAPISTTSEAPPRQRKKPSKSRIRVTASHAVPLPGQAAAAKTDLPLRDVERVDRRDEVAPDPHANAGVAAKTAPTIPEPSGAERRTASRHDFDRRVIVLSEEAARVLLGRDLASGGMRVNADSNLVVGDRLRIALHVRSGEVPLVVNAKVLRDDGERGMVLTFEGLSDADRNYLEKMVGTLPVVSGDEDGETQTDGDCGGVVVTEILDRS